MVRVTRSISKLLTKSDSRTGIEMDSFDNGRSHERAKKYYAIRENTLMHTIVLFEWLERYISLCAPYAMGAFAAVALLFTMISIFKFPDGIHGDNHACAADEVENIRQMRRLNIAFMICCLFGIAYLMLFAHLTKIQAEADRPGIRNCFRIGSHPRFLHLSSIMGLLMWLVLAALCWVRFIDFLKLSPSCQHHIVHNQTVLFLSVIGTGIFAMLMSIIAWITLLSYVGLALIVLLMGIHLVLLYFFYRLGWNFAVHSIVEFLVLFNVDIVHHEDFEDHCAVRFVFVSIIFVAVCGYFVVGILELMFKIKSDATWTKRKREKVRDAPSAQLLDESAGSRKYSVALKSASMKSESGYRVAFKWARRVRILLVSTLYLSAVVHAIIVDIIDETTGEETDECRYEIGDSATFYSQRAESLFIIAMILDLLLFGYLFKSWKLLMDPVFWLTRYVWHLTRKVMCCVMALLVTLSALWVLSVMFLMHDLKVL